MTTAENLKKKLTSIYPLKVSDYERTYKEGDLCKYEITFKDGSRHVCIMTHNQSNHFRRVSFWNEVRTIGGLGYVKPIRKS